MQTVTAHRLRRSPLACTVLCLAPLLTVACGQDEDGGSRTSTSTGGSGGTSAADGSTSAPHADDVLVDDFEDGNGSSALETDWYSYTDIDDGGASVLTISAKEDGSLVMDGEGHSGSAHSLKLGVSFDQGDFEWSPYVGVGTTIPSTVDMNQYKGITYSYRGSAHALHLQTSDVTDYDYFAYNAPASADWTTVTVAYSSFVQAGFGTVLTFDPTLVSALVWQLNGPTGTTADLEVDDVYLAKNEPAATPDWVVHEPDPPTQQTLTNIAVDSELQALATQYLNRGYNITNWLEEGKFTGFTYDEGFVERLAAAGFQGLRLPIDLDLYITERDTSSGALVLTIDDSLWTVLDSFVDWTENYGLSLTIDYHGYDRSFSLTEPSTIADVESLWAAVARRYASNTREDLFYEILNETEQLTGATQAIAAATLTPVAERMIAAIRAEDPSHPIIFGDTNWYGLDNLSARTPFPAADRVIYAFHFYEPYIFTHQGASWAQMAATHDIPYPYDPERWSEYSSDLGFNTAMPSWILAAAQTYYQTGNKATLYNRIAKVKQWAVDNGVPVICNEFGAYDQTSQMEDRQRYYTDLVAVFDELEIPWQLWFMIMDVSTGEIDTAYSTALGLGG